MISAFLFGFILGIGIGSYIALNIWIFIAIALLGAIVFIYYYFVSESDKRAVLAVSLFISSVFLGMGRMYFSDLNQGSTLDRFANNKIQAIGIVVSEPDVRDENTKLTVRLNEVDTRTNSFAVDENVLVTVPMYPEFQYGDKVKMKLTLVSPNNIQSDDGRSFDYLGYLRVRGIWYTSRFAEITLLSHGNGSTIKTLLFKTKKLFTASIDRALPSPESALMTGLILGTKQSLGKDLLDEFQRSGVSHLVVLSGYNIAIVAESIMKLLSFLPRTLSFTFGITSIILFTILSGGGASGWRAAIMVIVALFAKHMNRDFKASRALGFAIIVMLAPNPLLLAFDPSFQLSILATLGLIFVSPLVTPHLLKLPEKFGIREIVGTTIATQITVLPFLIYNTGIVSFVSLPVNVLVLGTVPITMLFGFITGALGILSWYLSFVPAVISYVLLKYQLTIIHIGSIIPFGTIKLPTFSPGVLLGIYAVIVAGWSSIKYKPTFGRSRNSPRSSSN